MRNLATRIVSAIAALACRTGVKCSEILESELDVEKIHREAKRVAALTDEELDRELIEAGHDPAQLRARGRALVERTKQRLALENAATPGSDGSAT